MKCIAVRPVPLMTDYCLPCRAVCESTLRPGLERQKNKEHHAWYKEFSNHIEKVYFLIKTFLPGIASANYAEIKY
jgi:hypothetical protein